MGLLVAALPRPRMQRQLVLLGRAVIGGSIDDARLAERDIGKRRIARRLVIDMGAAERGGERGIGDQRVVDGGAQRDGGGWHGGFLATIDDVVPAKAGTHNPWHCLLRKASAPSPKTRAHGVWVPAFAGTTAEFTPPFPPHRPR